MVNYDIAIIGGGINGCGIARDAAGRGLKVALFEQGDLGQGTSSASTKLIHGGLRYLEYYEFRLVREALTEREVLWKIAPHIIWPLRFVLPYQKGLRPAWMIRLGLFLYDHIGGRKLLRGTKTVDLRQHAAGKPLKPGYKTGFEYSDCWVMDARLVMLNARDAAARGARVETRTKVTHARRAGDGWQVDLQRADGTAETIAARILINAAGPWVGDVLRGVVPSNTSAAVRMVQGSHIVVPKMFEHKRAYIFQNPDNRIIFAIPYERDFTLIGTTDRDYKGDPAAVHATEEEISYLCAAASEYFSRPVRREDVVWTYSGVRPLYDDGASKAQEATRDYVLHVDDLDGAAPFLSIFGGKITTYRRLAEAVLDKLDPYLPAGVKTKAGWTGKAALPGGDFPQTSFQYQAYSLRMKHPFLSAATVQRLVRTYGTEAAAILGEAKSVADLGRHFGHDLYECELRHMIGQEWVKTGEDALWRRTKLGLNLDAAQAAAVDAFVRAQVA
jgi:glycerol-3-phosphate dehydrogenase